MRGRTALQRSSPELPLTRRRSRSHRSFVRFGSSVLLVLHPRPRRSASSAFVDGSCPSWTLQVTVHAEPRPCASPADSALRAAPRAIRTAIARAGQKVTRIIQGPVLARFLRFSSCTSAAHSPMAGAKDRGRSRGSGGMHGGVSGTQGRRLAPGGLRNRGNPRGPYAGRQ